MSSAAEAKQQKLATEALKKTLREKAREMKRALEVEEANINFFQQERERINYVWMLQKKKIEENQAELINKRRELEDLEEKHKIEKKLHFQRIKFLMLMQQDESVELQKEAEIALKQKEDANRIKEKDYKYDIRTLSQTRKEQEVLQNDFLHALEKDNIKNIHQLKNDFELKEYQLRRFYREKIKELQINMEEKRKKIINDITEKKKLEIEKNFKNHLESFEAMKNYYSDFNKKNLNNLKKLAEKINEQIELQKKQRGEKNSLMNQKKKIEDPLKKLELDIEINRKKEEECLGMYKELKDLKAEYSMYMAELLDLEYKYEVTFQKIIYLEKEKDSLKNRYKDNLHTLEQKAGLRNLILEKKLETIEDNIEIKDAQLKELIKKNPAIDPSSLVNINNTLDEIELMKGELINQLEEELKKIKEAHINMIKTYESKLAEFGIPVEEMGFEPLIPVDIQKSS